MPVPQANSKNPPKCLRGRQLSRPGESLGDLLTALSLPGESRRALVRRLKLPARTVQDVAAGRSAARAGTVLLLAERLRVSAARVRAAVAVSRAAVSAAE